MHIKKGDNVKMLSGKDRNKTGKILHVFPKTDKKAAKVVVDGLNKIKKHLRAKKQGQKGQIIEKERAVDTSSVQLVCSKCGKPTRTGHRTEGDKKVRVCKKCDGIL